MIVKAIAINAFRIFVFLFLLFLPLKTHLLPGFNASMNIVSSSILSALNPLFGIQEMKYANMVFSDSSGMYLFALYVLVFSFLIALLAHFKFQFKFNQWGDFFDVFAVYFTVFILLKYGFDKVFFNQFYPVNPALLYTEFGNLSKDIVFWSLAGSSKFYQFFSGAIELLAATLILFKRTRRMGCLLALLIFVNICLINFSFDISVKLFSVLMLAICLYVSRNFIVDLFRFLIYKGEYVQEEIKSDYLNKHKKWLKPLVVVLMLMETTFPFVLAGNRSLSKPNNHIGAFKVKESGTHLNLKELFLLENHRMVVKTKDGEMLRGEYNYSADKKTIRLNLPEIFPYPTELNTQIMVLKMRGMNGVSTELKMEKLQWENKALRNDGFHWTLDNMMTVDAIVE